MSTQIIDCAGIRFGWVLESLPVVGLFANMAAWYPERLGKCVIVNGPSW